MKRIANRDAGQYVRNKEHFKGSNLFTDELELPRSTLYIVYSYGRHFPMFIAETDEDNVTRWYMNVDKYSRSTGKQKTQAHPGYHMTLLNTREMLAVERGGFVSLIERKLNP